MSINLKKDEPYKSVKVEGSDRPGPRINVNSLPETFFDQSDTEILSKMAKTPEMDYGDDEASEAGEDHTPSVSMASEMSSEKNFDNYSDVSLPRDEEEYYPTRPALPALAEAPRMSEYEIKKKKADYICKINILDPNRKYSFMNLDMNTDLSVIENEFIRIERQIDLENGTSLVKQAYIAASAGIEFFSARQKFMALNLTNWSYKVAIECNESKYEKVFSQIYEQYLSSMDKVDPMMALVFMTVMSAAQFHYSNNPADSNKQTAYNIMDDPDDDMDSIISKLEKRDKEADLEDLNVGMKNLEVKEEVKPKKRVRGRPKKL